MKPLVSIIVPVYNRETLIEATLDSIKSQSFESWECIIVDDGSNDGTLDILSKWSQKDDRFRVFSRPEALPKGANSCRNFGFEHSSGQLINWFDSDDIMLDDFLDNKVKAFGPETEVIICGGYFTDETLQNRENITLIKPKDPYVDFAMWRFRVFTPSVMFKRSFLESHTLYDKAIKKYQDTEFLSRMFKALDRSQIGILNEFLFLYRRHQNAMSVTDNQYIAEEQESIAYIYLQRFNTGLERGNRELIDYFYQRIIALWFRAFRNGHMQNCEYVENKLDKTLIEPNRGVFRKVKLIFAICKFLKTGSHKLKTYLESQSKNIKAIDS